MSSGFRKNVEDFTCEHCGFVIVGNGYTNHCPKCLWSKHVDVNPGDRAETCKGMMEPITCVFDRGQYSLIHRCVVCGHEKKNKVELEDDFDVAIAIAKKNSRKYFDM